MTIRIKALGSMSLAGGELPPDPEKCALLMEAHIGDEGSEGADLFYFTVVTLEYLVANPETRWGKGYLLVERFDWQSINASLQKLLASVSGHSMQDATTFLSKFLDWEFDDYRPGQ